MRPGYALVKIHFSALQPSDKLNAKGGFPKTTFPRIPGRDYSGEVVEVDPSSGLEAWIGKQVYGTSGSELGFTIDGPHAEFCLIPEEMLVEKPSSLSPCQAATIGVPFTAALRCLIRAQASAGDIVLVLGASGAVGSAAVKIAGALGGIKVLTASRRQEDAPSVLIGGPITLEEQISTLTDGKGVNVVIDTVGNIDLMHAAVEQLAVRGRYVWIASPRDGSSRILHLDTFQSYRKEIQLIGCNTALTAGDEVAEELRRLRDLFDSGKLEASGEADIQRIKFSDAIERGYSAAKLKKNVVFDMSDS